MFMVSQRHSTTGAESVNTNNLGKGATGTATMSEKNSPTSAEKLKLEQIASDRCDLYEEYLKRKISKNCYGSMNEADILQWLNETDTDDPFSALIADCLIWQLMYYASPKAADNVLPQVIMELGRRFPAILNKSNYVGNTAHHISLFQASSAIVQFHSFRKCLLGSVPNGHVGAEHIYPEELVRFLIPSCSLSLCGLRLEVFLLCSKGQVKGPRTKAWTLATWKDASIKRASNSDEEQLEVKLRRVKHRQDGEEPINAFINNPEAIERFRQLKRATEMTYGKDIKHRYIFEDCPENLSMEINRLSGRAGYWKNFFSAHSIKVSSYNSTIIRNCLDHGLDTEEALKTSHGAINWQGKHTASRYARISELAKIPKWREEGLKYDNLSFQDAHGYLGGVVPAPHRTRVACKNDPITPGVRDVVLDKLQYLDGIGDVDYEVDMNRPCDNGSTKTNRFLVYIDTPSSELSIASGGKEQEKRSCDSSYEYEEGRLPPDQDDSSYEYEEGGLPPVQDDSSYEYEQGKLPPVQDDSSYEYEEGGLSQNNCANNCKSPFEKILPGPNHHSARMGSGDNGQDDSSTDTEYSYEEGRLGTELASDNPTADPYSAVHGMRCSKLAELLFKRLDVSRITEDDRKTWAKYLPTKNNKEPPDFFLDWTWAHALQSMFTSTTTENPMANRKSNVDSMMTYITKVMIHMGFMSVDNEDLGSVHVPEFIIQRLALPPAKARKPLDETITNEGNTRKKRLGVLGLRGYEEQSTKPRKKLKMPDRADPDLVKQIYAGRCRKGLRSIVQLPDRDWVEHWKLDLMLQKDGNYGSINYLVYSGCDLSEKVPRYNVTFTKGNGTQEEDEYTHFQIEKMRRNPNARDLTRVSVYNFDVRFPVELNSDSSEISTVAYISEFRKSQKKEEYLLKFMNDESEDEWVAGKLVDKMTKMRFTQGTPTQG